MWFHDDVEITSEPHRHVSFYISCTASLRRAANALKILKASPLGIFFKYGNNIIRYCVALCFLYEIMFNYREIMYVKFGGGRSSLYVHPTPLANSNKIKKS